MTRQDSPNPRPSRTAARAAGAAALALGVLTASCEDDFFEPRWGSAIDTVQLFSLARPELNLPAAFSFNRRRTFRVEAATSTGNWDIAVDTQGDGLVFLPPGALGISSRAGIAPRPGVAFEEVEEAPTDSASYTLDEPVPAEVGTVYVVRTGRSTTAFGTRCVYFAKFEPLEIDTGVGTVRFLYEANPICNDPSLVPTEGENG